MPLADKPMYIREPDPLQCGQAVLAMLTGKTVDEMIAAAGTERETTLADMLSVLEKEGITVVRQRIPVNDRSELPDVCILSLETPRCWHWSLYFEGRFYDPEHGESDDFPVANRKYYWEIKRAGDDR